MLLEFEFVLEEYLNSIFVPLPLKEFLGAIKGTEGKFIKEDIS